MTIILTQSTTRGQEEVVRLLVGVEGVDLATSDGQGRGVVEVAR